MTISKTSLLMMLLLGCVLSEIIPLAQTYHQSADLMINGGFDQSQCVCSLNWCGWNTQNFTNAFVPSWIPQPEI
jgi:hypothetical protein